MNQLNNMAGFCSFNSFAISTGWEIAKWLLVHGMLNFLVD